MQAERLCGRENTMNRQEVLKRVVELFSIMTDEEIFEESELVVDLGISSMDILTLMSYIEEEFQIKIAVCNVCKMVTVRDVVDFIMNTT